MSWLGGLNDSFTQLSSLTGQLGGQISSFTKEVLTESSGENTDHEVEAEKLKQQLIRYDAHLKEKDAQIEQLKQENLILHEKVSRAELSISTSEIEYEARLQQKSKEIALLKEKLSDGDHFSARALGAPILSSSFSTAGADPGDDHFHEIITYQQEVERLSHELEEVSSQRDTWKAKAESHSSVEHVSESRQNPDLSLLDRVKELEAALHRESKHHQQELKTIQDAHAATVTRYQNENRKLKLQVAASADHEGVPDLQLPGGGSQDVNKILSELDTLKEQLRTKNRQLQAQKKNFDELKSRFGDAEKQTEALQNCNTSMTQELDQLRIENSKLVRDRQLKEKNLQDIYDGVREIIATTEGQARIVDERTVLGAIKELCLQNSNRHCADARRSDSDNGKDLAESDQWHNVELLSVAEEDQNVLLSPGLEPEDATEGPFPPQSGSSQVGEAEPGPGGGNHGDLTMTLEALQKQVEDYEHEMEQYERAQSEWQMEKQSLQDLLNRYENEIGEKKAQVPLVKNDERKSTLAKVKQELQDLKGAKEALEKETNRLVQEKDRLQVATKNLEDELNSSISEAQLERGQVEALKSELEQCTSEKEKVQAAFGSITQELNASRSEKDELLEALDALDSQHQDEMAQLLIVRDNLKQKLKSAEEETAQIKGENDILAKESARLKGQAEEHRSNTKLAGDLEAELKTARRELEEANAAKLDMDTQAVKAEQELKELTKEIENLKFANETIQSECEQAKQNMSSFQNEVVTLEKRTSELILLLNQEKAKCQQLADENQKLHENINQTRSSIPRTVEELSGTLQKELSTAGDLFHLLQLVFTALNDEDNPIRIKDDDARRLLESVGGLEQLLQENCTDFQTERIKNKVLFPVKNAEESHMKILELEKNLKNLNSSLEDKQTELEKLFAEKQGLESRWTSESARLQEEVESLCAELKNSGKDVAQRQAAHEAEIKKLKTEHDEGIQKLKENSAGQLAQLEESFSNYKLESEAAARVYVDKIAHLGRANANLHRSLEVAEARHIDTDAIESLREQNSQLTGQVQSLLDERNLLQADYTELKQELCQNTVQNGFDGKNAVGKEDSAVLSKLQENSDEPDRNHEDFVDGVWHTKNDCDLRIESLLNETEELKRRLTTQKNEPKPVDQVVDRLLAEVRKGDIADLEKADLSKEDIGSLLRLIKERGEVISLLAQRSAAEDKSAANISTLEVLQETNRSLVAEKDQILAVISEKTRENKKLKDESHRMTHVVAEGQAALAKVQQENASLRARYEGYDREMTKEAVTKLSRLVMEKELEITSLKQKCATLLEVLQQPTGGTPMGGETSLSGQQVQSLLQDKETLTSQVQQLLAERNHLVALWNQSQAELQQLRSEVADATKAMERDSDTNSKLQISFGNLVHEYEQTQMKLASVQRELSELHKKSFDLENMKESLFAKIQEGSARTSKAPQKSKESPGRNDDSSKADHDQCSDVTDQSGEALRGLREEVRQKAVEMEKLTNDCREKDVLIHSRMHEMIQLKKDLEAKSAEVVILRKSVGNLREQVAEVSKENEGRRMEILNYSGRLEEKEAEAGAFQETNAQLSMLLKEKEYEIENARDKCRSLEAMVRENQQGKESESQKLLLELDQSKQNLIVARHERDQVMLSLKQRKMEADKYSEEARMLREKETKLQSELARLRNHLVQVEEAYTQEAILAGDREQSVREQLKQFQTRSSAAQVATEQSQQQIESLQEQLRAALAQRDQAVHQRQLAQEQSMQYATALQKLQAAVERMQREEADTFREQINALKSQLETKNDSITTLESQLSEMKVKLQDAKDALTSASRLNKQLELKEENIEQLKSLVAEKQVYIDDLQDRIHIISTKNEGMVDKEIVKNLVIGYFTTPTNKRDDVLRLITSVLGFSQGELLKLQSGVTQGRKTGWMGGWLGGWRGGGSQSGPGGSVPSSPTNADPNQSFTQMFVKFLENESVPHQAARLPAAAMVHESQQKINQRRIAVSPVLSSVPTPVRDTSSQYAPAIAGRFSPFLHTNPTTSTPTKGQAGVRAQGQTVLMHPVTPILPTFSTVANSNHIKQDTLQDILLSTGDR